MRKRRVLKEDVRYVVNKVLPVYEKEDLIEVERASKRLRIRDDLNKTINFADIPDCPCCHSSQKVVKRGKNTKNQQKYYCTKCRKFLPASNNSLLKYTQMEDDVLLDFIKDVLYKNNPVVDLAHDSETHDHTAFVYKLKIMQAAEILNKKVMLSNRIEADETFENFNAKGQDFTNIYRAPRKRGGPNSGEDKIKNSICIVVAVDRDPTTDRRRIVSRIVGFGNASGDRICKALNDKIAPNENTVLITDGSYVYSTLVKKHELVWERLVTNDNNGKRTPRIKNGDSVQTVNHYHMELHKYLGNMHGVSSKYLPGHLELFDFCINYGHLDAQDQAMLILKTLYNETEYQTVQELIDKYKTPRYEDQIAKNWSDKFKNTELEIYQEVFEGTPRNEVARNHNISIKKVYYITNKIQKARTAYYEEIGYKEENLTSDGHPIPNFVTFKFSKKSWDMYVLQRTRKYSYAEIGRMYGCSRENVHSIVESIDKTEYAYPMAEIPKTVKESKRYAILARNEKLYNAYTVLAMNKTKTLKQIHIELAEKFNLSANTVRNILQEMKTNDPCAIWRKPGTRIEIDYDHEIKLQEAL